MNKVMICAFENHCTINVDEQMNYYDYVLPQRTQICSRSTVDTTATKLSKKIKTI